MWEKSVESESVLGFVYRQEAGMAIHGLPESLGMKNSQKLAPAVLCILLEARKGKKEIPAENFAPAKQLNSFLREW